MERPTSIFGLTTHLVRTRWQALSPRGRTFAIVAATALGVSGAWGVSAMTCDQGGCEGGCPMARARAQAQMEQTQAESGDSPCHAE